MPALNIFIDGSWLFRVCAAEGSLANATDRPDDHFRLDFQRLNDELLKHVRSTTGGEACDLGELLLSISIFDLPSDFDSWPSRVSGMRPEHVQLIRNGVWARERFVREAEAAGYRQDAVFRLPVREWMIRKFVERRYLEKQVDTTIVALLVRAAITRANDFHALITGDADMLPAIKIACPNFTENVFVATTHPDELDSRHRHTAFSLVEIGFKIPPYFMQNKGNAEKIIAGRFPYRCEECGRVFVADNSIRQNQRPRCQHCRPFEHRGGNRWTEW